MDLQQLLANCQNPDATVRQQAEAALQAAGQQDLGQLMLALVTELARDDAQEMIRQQAGMYVKLLLTAQDESIKQAKLHQWNMVEPTIKAGVKALVLQALHSQSSQAAKHVAAMVIGKMGAIELPHNLWPEMLGALLENVTGNFQDGTKVASLEALGYMCEQWEPDDMNQAQTNQILTCIVDGIRADRPSSIRFAAAQALLNSLYFTRKNFDNKDERDMIMQVICEATQCSDPKVRRVAYEGISRIAQLYYSQLDSYMTVLFQLTVRTIKEDQEEVALQAIEFWSTMCDEEQAIKEEVDDYGSIEANRSSRNYVAMAVPHIVPLLLEALTKQTEDHDEDEWSLATAGATCLGLVAQLVEDMVVDAVVPYVTANIQSENWHNREAAIMAFGSILEGPSPEKLRPLVTQAMPVLINAMRDPNVVVKDTATWTIGKICDLHAQSISAEMLTPLVEALVRALDDIARVCKQACFALHSLGQAFDGAKKDKTNRLSPYFRVVLEKLLGVLRREDFADSNTRASAFEAINSLVSSSAEDVRDVVLMVLGVVLELLQATFGMQILSSDDRDKQQTLQSLLCGNIQVICQKVGPAMVSFSDRVMMLLLEVFKNKSAVAQEEAFLAAGALVDCMPFQSPQDPGFKRYMPNFVPILLAGLQNYEEYQVCCVAVGVVGDLCRGLGKQMGEYADNIFILLLKNLEDANIHRTVKPPVLACLGDLCLALGGDFERFLQVTMEMLAQVQGRCLPLDTEDIDEDFLEYLNVLCATVLEAYTSIINGLADDDKAKLLLPYLGGIVHFLTAVAAVETKTDEVTSRAVGVLGDVAKNIGVEAKPALTNPGISSLLRQGLDLEDESHKEVARWAQQNLQQLEFGM